MNSLIDDRDDDVRLPSRGSEQRTPPRDEAVSHAGSGNDHEVTLSTGTVLGIFFALALICAVFFGFGYSLGRKSGQSSAEATAASAAASSEAASAAKPAAGAPAIQAIPGYMSQSEADAANRSSAVQTYRAPATASGATAIGAMTAGATTVIVPTPPASSAAKPPKPVAVTALPSNTVASSTVPVERKPTEVRPAAVAAAIPPSVVAPSVGSSYVQIAAVSHQEDADVLLSALKRRGYSVFARPGDTDRLIHVQVGPFPTKKDADAMRQKLLGDGYNAIVK